MIFIKWSNTYSVGIKEIDEQHQQLFEMINNFHNSLDKADATAPKKFLINLMEYILYHFKTEETYFKKFEYSDTKSHIKEHEKFEIQISEFRVAYQSRKTFNASTVLDYMKKWVIDHVLITDKKYIKCFHEHGLK